MMKAAGFSRDAALSPPTISEICGNIVRVTSLSAVASKAGVELVEAGAEWKACCPFHADRTPSFTIYDRDRRWCCFGCGRQGDVLDFVQEAYRVSLLEAIDILDSGALSALPTPQATDRTSKDSVAFAASIWRSTSTIAGTAAEAYLRGRGLTLDLPPTLRFARLKPPKDSSVAAMARGSTVPALVALVTDPGGTGVGIQRTYLTDDGRKAPSTDGKVKFSLGRVRGGAIQLAAAAAELIVTEGLEDGLTLAQELERPVWVAAGTSMLPAIALSDAVRTVIIGADGDVPGETAAHKAGRAFVAGGRSARIMRPEPPHKDFNAQLVASMAGVAA